MKRRFNILEILGLMAAAVLVVAQIGATLSAKKPGQCSSFLLSSTASDNYIATSGRTIIVQVEADTASTGTGTEVTFSACTAASANECELYYFDTDWDGAPDSAILTGSSWPNAKRGARIENVAGYVLANTTAYSDAGQLNYCFAE